MPTTLIIFFTTLVATLLSAASGGGASAINVPVFLWLGMPFALATATQKVSSAFWVLPAAYNYLRGRKVDWQFLIAFATVGLIGVSLGLIVILAVGDEILRRTVGALILLFVLFVALKRDLGLAEKPVTSKFRNALAYPGAVALGFYESIFGAGNGIAFAILSFYTKGFDFIDALGYYFAIAFVWVLFAAVLLISKGNYDLVFMMPAVLGSLIGGWLGSKLGRLKGNQFIKTMYVVIGGVLGVKLLLNL